MTHDYIDAWASELLDLIHKLEERIIALEQCNDKLTYIAARQHLPDDHYYWNHG